MMWNLAFSWEDPRSARPITVTQSLDSAAGVLGEDSRKLGSAREREPGRVAIEVRKIGEVALRFLIEAKASV